MIMITIRTAERALLVSCEGHPFTTLRWGREYVLSAPETLTNEKTGRFRPQVGAVTLRRC
jgi:hypothetical protein